MKTNKLKKKLGKPIRSTVGFGQKLGTKIETPAVKYDRKKKYKKDDY